jgi:enoyl-CoA hydratase
MVGGYDMPDAEPRRQRMTGQGASNTQGVLDVTIEDGIAHLKLNRPDKLNSMNRAFWSALPAAVRDIDENARARVIVISSTGKHFSAGMDLEVFAENGALAAGQRDPHVAAEAFRHLVLSLQETFSCLDEARMPVIAAIQGGCIGGAVDMTSACDIRYCTADAFFCIQEINLAMTADVGTFPRLCKLIPEG